MQIAPFGDWPNVDVDDSPLTQSEMGEEHLKNKNPEFPRNFGVFKVVRLAGVEPAAFSSGG